jgi:hypothetical protein
MGGWGSSGGEKRSPSRVGISEGGSSIGGSRSDSYARGKGRVHSRGDDRFDQGRAPLGPPAYPTPAPVQGGPQDIAPRPDRRR